MYSHLSKQELLPRAGYSNTLTYNAAKTRKPMGNQQKYGGKCSRLLYSNPLSTIFKIASFLGVSEILSSMQFDNSGGRSVTYCSVYRHFIQVPLSAADNIHCWVVMHILYTTVTCAIVMQRRIMCTIYMKEYIGLNRRRSDQQNWMRR